MMSKKSSLSSSSIVQSSSFSTLCVFSLFSFTIFIIYRYVKSLEKEVKLLSGKLDTLSMASVLANTESMNAMSNEFNETVRNSNDNVQSTLREEKNAFYNDDEEEAGTVKSEEVIELMADLHEDEPEYCIPTSNDTKQDNLPDEEDDDDDVQLVVKDVLDEESLKKKTNDELKKMLKAKDKNVKGTKAELINRLLEINEGLE